MKRLTGQVAVITGAASGIGQALAFQLAKEGCHLALSDINEEALMAMKPFLQSFNQTITYTPLDVSDKEAMYKYAYQVFSNHGQVDLLFNNAGVTSISNFAQMSDEDFEWVININFWGVVYGTRAFIPYLERSSAGHLINISSIFGLIGFPSQSAYNASKFAVRGFTEALSQELRIARSKVIATCVHPGGIKTNITKGARFGILQDWMGDREQVIADFQNKMAHHTPEYAANKIILGVKRGKRRILIGSEAYLVDWTQRFLPVGYQRLNVLAAKVFGKTPVKKKMVSEEAI